MNASAQVPPQEGSEISTTDETPATTHKAVTEAASYELTAAAEMTVEPPKKRPRGRPKGFKTNHNRTFTVEDPASDLTHLNYSNEYIQLLRKKKLPQLADAYTTL
ncbi:hypothetical protein ACHAWO_004059 [Cyclotella atomus]|jgi:hypothetical protein|uniref:Uncharacterized protein n=1 Tax=Cyclotella atomus TaxID=382360 RepID=A0ABD3MYG2_9STRA